MVLEQSLKPDRVWSTENHLGLSHGMKIYVSRIPEEGLKDHASYDPAAMDMDREDIRLREPFEVEAVMSVADRELVVNVDIRCPVHPVCARCLEEFDSTVTARTLFTYQVHPTDIVDITDDVRQEIVLAYPMVPICRPDCKGLCRTCGHNLNRAACSHQAADSRGADEPHSGGSIAV